MAIEFFGRHIGIGGVTIDGLSATSGTADYIAMRESLVNLFIHQDYNDTSAAGQIEITKDRATFFNTGKSLVSQTNLVEGGKSQSRNPLISRALRLIGFAELAGSGLREVRRVWNQERRRPPIIQSNPKANTFTLTLDWRTLPEITDEFWKQRLGLKLTPHEAYALLLSAETNGTSAEEIAAAQGLYLDEGREIYKRLVKESLVSEKDGKIYIKDHLMQLVEEAKAKPASG
jgi:predicted HTH transcriptional regulator